MNTRSYSIYEQAFLDQVKAWIELDGEVYISFGYARSGGAGGELLIRAFDEFEKVVSTFQNRKGGIEVYRHPRLLLRGIANEELLLKALEIIPDETDWFLFHNDPLNAALAIGTGDNTHQELRQAFVQFCGCEIALGLDRDFPPQERQEGQDYISASTLESK